MRPPQPWRAEPTLRFLATLLLGFAASMVAAQVLIRTFTTDPSQPPAWQLACATGVLHAVGIIAVIPLLRTHGFGWREGFGLFQPPWARTALRASLLTLPALAVAWGVHQLCVSTLEAIGHAPDLQQAVDAVRNSAHGWERFVLLAFAAGSAPVFEELVFRGILWPALRDRGFRLTGCLAVSVLFASIHANLAAFLPLCLLGMFWTWLYERSGDLTAPMLSHALFNATNFVWILAAPGEPAPAP
jgi:membrane protease YdiL (CAAX protease family)